MHGAYFLTVLAAGLSSTFASPIDARAAKGGLYHGVTVLAVTSAPGQTPEVYKSYPVGVPHLHDLANVTAYKLRLADSNYHNVNISMIECRGYKDEAGQVPGSATFNVKQEAFLATNPVEVGSVLCYTVTEAEAAKF